MAFSRTVRLMLNNNNGARDWLVSITRELIAVVFIRGKAVSFYSSVFREQTIQMNVIELDELTISYVFVFYK